MQILQTGSQLVSKCLDIDEINVSALVWIRIVTAMAAYQ